MHELPGGRLEVFTFKEGLLSGAAHDLMLELERFEIRTDGARVEARFYPATLRVVGVMRDGQLDQSAPSARDRSEIAENIRSKILHTDRHRDATFEANVQGDDDPRKLIGTLTLHGHTTPMEVEVRERAGMWQGEVELRPSSFGIAPFKALLGAIKLQDRVIVRFAVPIVRL
jgi:hypothetical protein